MSRSHRCTNRVCHGDFGVHQKQKKKRLWKHSPRWLEFQYGTRIPKRFRPAVCKIFLCTQSTSDGIPRQAHCKGGVTIIVSRTHNLQIRSSTVNSGTVWFIRLTENRVSTLLFIHRDVPWAQERRELVRAKFEGSYRRYFCCWSPLILHDSCFNKESSKLNGALVLGVNGGARLPVSVWNDS